MCHKKGWICGACNGRFVDPPLYPCDLAADRVFPNRHCKKHWWVLWEPKDLRKTDDENEEKNRAKRCPGCEPGRVASEQDVESEQGVQHTSDTDEHYGDESSSTMTGEPGDRTIGANPAKDVELDQAEGCEPRQPEAAADQVEHGAHAAIVSPPESTDLDLSGGEQAADEEHVARAETKDPIGAEARTEAQTAELAASLDYDEQFPPLPSTSPALSGGTNSMHTVSVAVAKEHSSLDRNDNALVLPPVDVPAAVPALVEIEQSDRVASGFAEPGPQNGHAVEQGDDDDDLLDGEYDMMSPEEAEEGLYSDANDDEEYVILEGEDQDDQGHGVVDDYGIPLNKELPPRPDEA